MKILYSGFRDPKHSQSGGYDKITNINLEKRVLLSSNYIGGKVAITSSWSRIPFFLLDIHTRILRNKYDVTHFFYGELTSIPLIPYHKSKKHKTIITLHLRMEDHRLLNLYLNQLRSYDGIIVLSTNQKRELKHKYGIESVFIPHGFSKPTFQLTSIIDNKLRQFDSSKINISLIGSNYRDFSIFRKIIDNYDYNNNIHFHIVGVPDSIKEYVKNHPNISVYNRLSDNEYYSLLYLVDYNFLPLTFATANNTLLEAQYLNTPSILPKIPGVSDYAAPSPLNYFYNSMEDITIFFKNIKKPQKNQQLEEFAKANFDWEVIYKKLKEYYEIIHSDK